MKLGKLPPKHHVKTLQFEKYLKPNLPAPPTNVYWGSKIGTKNWNMYGNDEAGDCTCATLGHFIMSWTSQTGTMVTPTDDDIIKAYSAISGYDPVTGANDNGAAITDVLNYWQETGIAGHKIDGWVQIDQTNQSRVKLATYLFGGVDLGIVVRQSDMDQFSNGQEWTLAKSSWLSNLFKRNPVLGGHSIPAFGYDVNAIDTVTWGAEQLGTWSWFMNRCEEAYAPLSMDWIMSNKEAPNHIDVSLLEQDLQALKK